VSLVRLLRGHGFFNTATYRVWTDYKVYEIDVEWADGETETIRCHDYVEKETGLGVKLADEPYIGDMTRKIHRGYEEDRVLVNMEEYTVRETGEQDERAKDVEVTDIGILSPSTPVQMYESVAETGYELIEVN